jgi:hypothetical protein
MVTDERTFSNQPLPEDALAPYRCDMSFVSNHSMLPDVFHRERRAWFAGDPAALALVDHLFETLLHPSASPTGAGFVSPEWLLRRAKTETGLSPGSTQADHALLHSYLYPLSELLLRQTTLEWVADYCDRTGRRLHLYGNGWESHPRFAGYARGSAKNGAELRAVYQASAINLQIVGTGAIHQRLLDGLAAGGFFLIRYTPGDVIREPAERLIDAVDRLRPDEGREYTRAEAPELAAALEGAWRVQGVCQSLDRFVWRNKFADRLRVQRADGYARSAGAVFDCYGDVAFATREEFEPLAGRYLDDAESRSAIARRMRAVVSAGYTYAPLVKRLLGWIRERLEAAASETGVATRQES